MKARVAGNRSGIETARRVVQLLEADTETLLEPDTARMGTSEVRSERDTPFGHGLNN
jgi:hypothetical protein